jgi:hypothetical protein
MSKIMTQLFQALVEIAEIDNFLEVAFVALISASQELREVHSWCSPRQPKGPPLQKTISPLMLLNLSKGSRVPSATALPT